MIKTFITISFFVAGFSFAQTTGAFSFKWTFNEAGVEEAATIDLYSSTNKVAIKSNESYGSEHIVLDRSTKTLLELFVDTEPVEQYYTLSTYEEDIEETAYISEILSSAIESSVYGTEIELLPEKKTIQGLKCQKFKLVDTEIEIVGWLALGVHVKIVNDQYYFDSKDGMMVEFEIVSGEDKMVISLVKYDSTLKATDPVFSMAIPAGYDNLDDYSGEEGEGEEEE